MNGKVLAGLESALHSAFVTFAGVSAGLLAAAISTGSASSPSALLGYVKANAFGYLIANIVCPALRGVHAAVTTPTSEGA